MDLVISFFALSSLLQLVQPVVPPLSFRTVVEITSGDSKVFSEESVRLRCIIPQNNSLSWGYLWFRESEKLPQTEENLVLWKTNVKESGKYYCQGVRNSMVGKIYTLKSLLVEIIVDGGSAILQVPRHPGLVGESLMLRCQVRGNIPIRETILYKDGVEVLSHMDPRGRVYLTNLTLEDAGLYSCRASWDAPRHMPRHTVSVISTTTALQVLEVLTQPIMEIVDVTDPPNPFNIMKLECHVQYNARDPAPPIDFYFYKNNKHLGTVNTQNYMLVTRSPGTFSCMATVPQMGLSRQSDPKNFEQVRGTQTTKPSSFPHGNPWISPSTDMTPVSPFEPSEPQSPTHCICTSPPTAPTVEGTQSPVPPLMTSQPARTTPSSTTQSADIQSVASETEDASGSGEMSGASPYVDME